MRRIAGLLIVAGLWLGQATWAEAQVAFSFGNPYSSMSYGSPLGMGGLGMPYGYLSYGGVYGGYSSYSAMSPLSYGAGFPIAGTTYYNSGYSAYVAPGAVAYGVSAYGGLPYGYGAGYGYPAYGVAPGYGSGYGYGQRTGYVATSPFMGLPRPFAGLVRVPR